MHFALLVVLLAGCPPYIGPNVHKANVGGGDGDVEIDDLGDLALIPGPPGYTVTDVVVGEQTWFTATGSGTTFLGYVEGDGADGVVLAARIEALTVDPSGQAWALDIDNARVSPVQRLVSGDGQWIWLDGGHAIGPAPVNGVWVSDRSGTIYGVFDDGSVFANVSQPGAAWGNLTRSDRLTWVLSEQSTLSYVGFNVFTNEEARADLGCGTGDVIRGESPDGNGWASACGSWWWVAPDESSGSVTPSVGTLSTTGAWWGEELWFTTTDDEGRPVIGFSDDVLDETDVTLHEVTLGSSLSTARVTHVDDDGTVWAVLQEFDGGGGIVRLRR